jgi:beta-lactamase regulating signal transducer with metallopeptidase domain
MNETLALIVPVLGRTLLHFLWQGAVIGVVAALLLQVLRDARPQARYAVACLALLSCALVPLFDIARQFATLGVGVATSAVPPATPAFGPVFGTATHALMPERNLDDVLPALVAVWAAGACTLSLRMAAGVWWVQRLCTTPQGGAQAVWQSRLDALAARFGLRRPVALRLVDALASPASAGWWRPVVLLPTALLARMPVELIEALLAHELAHIRRHDYLVNLLQGSVEALLFYHPVTWWLSRRIRIEREHIADRLAVEITGESRRLAFALSELSELAGSVASERLPSPALAAHGGQLMSRIEQLVRPSQYHLPSGRIAFPLLGLAAACIALLAHAQAGSTTASAAASHQAAKQEMGSAQVHATKTHHVSINENQQRTPFAIVRKDRRGITMSGPVSDAESIDAMRHDMPGDFLWFRKDGQVYVIEDPSIIQRAENAWAGTEELGKKEDALEAQMEPHRRKMEALDAQMDKLDARQEDHPAMDAAERRMQKLGEQQERLGAEQEKLAAAMARAGGEPEQERLSAELEKLSAQQAELGAQMEAQSKIMEAESARAEQNAQPMEVLSKEIDKVSKPMEALEKQMDALGNQMDQLSAKAERETLKLIDEAVAKGLAKPAPVRR